MNLKNLQAIRPRSLIYTVMTKTSNCTNEVQIQNFPIFSWAYRYFGSRQRRSLPQLRNGTYRIQIGNEEASWLVNMPLIGGIFGSILTGLIIDHVGRKRLILLSSVPFFISWILIGVAETSVLLHVARFIAGLLDGLSFTAVPMFLGEIAEPEIRGLLSSMCPTATVLAQLLVNILGNFLTIPVTAFACAAVSIIHCATFVWIPESPYFLIMKNRHEDARKSLMTFRDTDNVDAELQRSSEAVLEQNSDKAKFSDLFTMASNRKALLIVMGSRTVQQLSGIMTITFYSTTIFQESSSFIAPRIGSIIYFSVQLVIVVFSCVVVDRFGRNPLLLISLSGTFLCFLTSGTYLYIKNSTMIDTKDFNFILLASLLVFVVIYDIGLQTIPLVLISEMFPTNIKAFALCCVDVNFGIIASLVIKFFNSSSGSFGMHVPFYTFAVSSIFCAVFVIFCVPETKGRTLKEIQEFLKGNLKL